MSWNSAESSLGGLRVTELLGDFGQALAALQRELEQEREEVREIRVSTF